MTLFMNTEQYMIFHDTHPIFCGEPWSAWQFLTHAFPTQQGSGAGAKRLWKKVTLGPASRRISATCMDIAFRMAVETWNFNILTVVNKNTW
jgi:hypothetical protein